MSAAIAALLLDLVVEVLRAVIKKKLGRKQLPEPVSKEVNE